jgi:hypothetical protein
MRQSIRHANIGIGVAVLIVVIGVLVFRESDDALQLVGLATLPGSLGTYFVLEERARRRRSKRRQ